MKKGEDLREIVNDEKSKHRVKRKTSIITIMLLIFLGFMVFMIAFNSVSKGLAYKDTEQARVTIKVNGINEKEITEEIDNDLKNLNVLARKKYGSEILSNLKFVEKNGLEYIYESDKTNAELIECNFYVELRDLDEYYVETLPDYSNTNFNFINNNWEREDDSRSIEIMYSKKSEVDKEFKLKITNIPNENISEELYENIIIQSGNSNFKFDRIDGEYYIYKGSLVEGDISSYQYIYVPNIIEKDNEDKVSGIIGKLGDVIYKSSVETYDDFRKFKLYTDKNIVDIELIYTNKTTGILKEIVWENENSQNGQLEFTYTSRNNENGIHEIMSKADSSQYFLIFKEDLPEEIKISDEYLNNSEWAFIDEPSDTFNFPKHTYMEFTGNDFNIPANVISQLMNFYDSPAGYRANYTGKKYVYIKSTNTLYYLVEDIKLMEEKNIVNIKYVGNDATNKEFKNTVTHAYTISTDSYLLSCCSMVYRVHTTEFMVYYTNMGVEIKWQDADNKYSTRPESVILQVKNGEKVVEEATVGKYCNWSYNFELPKYDELGNKIEYTVDEREVNSGDLKYYSKNIVGNTIINKSNYEYSVDTSDINVYVYIPITFIGIIFISIYLLRKYKQEI